MTWRSLLFELTLWLLQQCIVCRHLEELTFELSLWYYTVYCLQKPWVSLPFERALWRLQQCTFCRGLRWAYPLNIPFDYCSNVSFVEALEELTLWTYPFDYCSNALFVEALDELTLRILPRGIVCEVWRLVVQQPHAGGYKSVCGSLEE